MPRNNRTPTPRSPRKRQSASGRKGTKLLRSRCMTFYFLMPVRQDFMEGFACVHHPGHRTISPHMKKIALKVETEHDRTWTYLDRSAGRGQIGPLYRTLRWMVQQLNFEHFQVEDEENGEILSLSGRDAVLEDATRDDVIERSKKRFRAVNLAGLFAQAREKGINQDSVPQKGTLTRLLYTVGKKRFPDRRHRFVLRYGDLGNRPATVRALARNKGDHILI